MSRNPVTAHVDQLRSLVADAVADPVVARLMEALAAMSGDDVRKIEREIGLYERTGLCTRRIRGFLDESRSISAPIAGVA